MDFLIVRNKATKSGDIEVYPDFKVTRSKDLMIRGGAFYAVWDEAAQLWSTDEYRAAQLIDQELLKRKSEIEAKTKKKVKVRALNNFSSKAWSEFKLYMSKIADNFTPLDRKITFKDDVVTRETYASKRLEYGLEPGDFISYTTLMNTLYNPEERHKLEWAIGSIIAGDSIWLQKFIVLYGDSGSGKSTFLNILQKLFDGYYASFDAKALTGSSQFAFESLRANPLVAVQHDVDLSHIEDNAKLNSIVSHEEIVMNIKNKSTFPMKILAMLFVASNKAVKITDAKSGIIRRLIDVKPSGRRVPELQYDVLVKRIDHELGAIAQHCLNVYKKAGPEYYNTYKPIQMLYETDIMFNFVSYNADMFASEPYITLSRAYALYKDYCTESNLKGVLPKHRFREELKIYFEKYEQVYNTGSLKLKDVFIKFLSHRLSPTIEYSEVEFTDEFLKLNPAGSKSILKGLYPNAKAAYANESGVVYIDVSTSDMSLSDIDETKTHFVMFPPELLTIDIDLKDEEGKKDLSRALEEAKNFPPTYMEVSQSGNALHLHYIYNGNKKDLANVFNKGVEIKKMVGRAAIRRRLSLCNNHPVTKLTGVLPTKPEKIMTEIKSEKGLRELIERNLGKKIHPGTYPSVMFIKKILDEAYEQKHLRYDVTDMQQAVLTFAANSTNHPKECIKLVSKMKWKSDHTDVEHTEEKPTEMAFFDIEVYPNFIGIVYELENSTKAVHITNPTSADAEMLFGLNLVGFNNKGYDNHILEAIWLGHSVEEVYEISKDIIEHNKRWYYKNAVGKSYLDVYDILSEKKSLKHLQIEHGLSHIELDIPWNVPITPRQVPVVMNYCENDVKTLKQILKIKSEDFNARKLLSALSGLPLNASTYEHNARILFGTEQNPQKHFKYTDLSVMFPGYTFDGKDSHYRGYEVGEGGFVYAEPGMYMEDVEVYDIESMHPNSIINLNLFGDEYTAKFKKLVDIRLATKHKDLEKAWALLGDQKHLLTHENASQMAYALKIHAVNIPYGLTMAKGGYFRDPRNVDNIVAKRGALFMIDLLLALQERGCRVLHIKTDSVKLLKPTKEDVVFLHDYAAKYGYKFSFEGTYDRFCLFNKAVYIARYKGTNKWDAVGAQYAHPYIYKTLFKPGEVITWKDLGETKSVTGGSHIYIKKGDNYLFQGRVGSFVPVKNEGGELLRFTDGKYYHVTGTSGYNWFPTSMAQDLGLEIDMSYYEKLLKDAMDPLINYGNVDLFFSKES